MKIIPQVKKYQKLGGFCNCQQLNWQFLGDIDDRVKKAAYRISEENTGLPVYIKHANLHSEAYELIISGKQIEINASSPAGAFYALITLKWLIKTSDGLLECMKINDYPDMEYRGFYQDTTRGRIPTLARLKKLVDTMADYKMNSLQLYVEHTYDFKEYAFCKEELGYLTKAEIMELDAYCKERFIELIPSLSCFGHLYHLLQCEMYKHLCELKDYQPSIHYYKERMRHHTINPLLDESFALITSLIDQHLEAFTSSKFNICCDETFDLGTGVNIGCDKGDLYLNFVNKLINYLEAKGKTVMMWGDIVLNYPERISELSDKLILLNWDYSANPEEEKIAALKDKMQIVCSGTGSWEGFNERIQQETANILKLCKYGKKYHAKGLLNTNWGDLGNPASIDMAMYGLILGACVSWDNDFIISDEYNYFVSIYHYGAKEAVEILIELGEIADYACWTARLCNWKVCPNDKEESFIKVMNKCENIIKKIQNTNFTDADLKAMFLVTAEANSLLIKWTADCKGYKLQCSVDFNKWLNDYKQMWLADSKPSELNELIRIFTCLEKNIAFE